MTLCGPLGSSCAGRSLAFWTWVTISFPKLQKPLVTFSNISSDPLSHTSSGTPYNANIRALNIAPEVFSIIPISFHSLFSTVAGISSTVAGISTPLHSSSLIHFSVSFSLLLIPPSVFLLPCVILFSI